MCLLLTSWGLISAPIFISLSLCLPCLFLLFYFGPALVCCLFSTQTLMAEHIKKRRTINCNVGVCIPSAAGRGFAAQLQWMDG